MEKPYAGKAVLKDSFNGLIIEIPSKKNWFLIFFFSIWLGGWTMGMLFGAPLALFSGFAIEGPFSFFPILWIIGWSVGGFFAIRKWLWMVAGKEILTFEPGTLTMRKRAALFDSGF